MQRDTSKDLSYFEYATNDRLHQIENLKEFISNGTGVAVRVYAGFYDTYKSLIIIGYSIGKEVNELKKYMPSVFENFFKMMELERGNEEYKYERLNVYIGLYEDILCTLCLGILFGMEPHTLEKFKTLADELRGRDLLLEYIWAAYKGLPLPVADKKLKLLYPKSFKQAADIFEAKDSDKAQLLYDYNSNWMKTKKSASWYGNLKLSTVDGACPYEGYWNIEGAAIAYVLQLDAASSASLKYFPHDLLQFAK